MGAVRKKDLKKSYTLTYNVLERFVLISIYELKQKLFNLGHSTLRFLNIWEIFMFTTNKLVLDIYNKQT